jgi:hypothetical protein
MATPSLQVARDAPRAADDEEDEVLVSTEQPPSLWIYLRGWLRIGLLISPTVILGVGLYLLLR